MTIERIIKQEIDIDIQEVTLLSKKEYKKTKAHIKPIGNLWWLHSPRNDDYKASVVVEDAASYNPYLVNFKNGDVDDLWRTIDNESVSVRPALRLNQKSNNLQIGDMLSFGGYYWTLISKSLALCDTEFCRMGFREDWDAQDAHIYEASDVKRYLDNWFNIHKQEEC